MCVPWLLDMFVVCFLLEKEKKEILNHVDTEIIQLGKLRRKVLSSFWGTYVHLFL